MLDLAWIREHPDEAKEGARAKRNRGKENQREEK